MDELHRTLVKKAGVPDEFADYTISAMAGAFIDAEVTGYESLIEAMTCDEKDRHVLAAAVRSDAAAIVTFNTKDFPAASVTPYAIEVLGPDDFLLDTLDLYQGAVLDELAMQAEANKWEPRTVPTLLDALERHGAPMFAAEARKLTQPSPP